MHLFAVLFNLMYCVLRTTTHKYDLGKQWAIFTKDEMRVSVNALLLDLVNIIGNFKNYSFFLFYPKHYILLRNNPLI